MASLSIPHLSKQYNFILPKYSTADRLRFIR